MVLSMGPSMSIQHGRTPRLRPRKSHSANLKSVALRLKRYGRLRSLLALGDVHLDAIEEALQHGWRRHLDGVPDSLVLIVALVPRSRTKLGGKNASALCVGAFQCPAFRSVASRMLSQRWQSSAWRAASQSLGPRESQRVRSEPIIESASRGDQLRRNAPAVCLIAFLSRFRCVGEVIARRGHYANAKLDQREDAQFLRHEIPGRSGWRPR